MKALYLVRHGQKNVDGALTAYGIAQVESLGEKLDESLPKDVRYALISSPSPRAVGTAEVLLPLLQRKSIKYVGIKFNGSFSELQGSLFYDVSIEKGKVIMPQLEEYFSKSDIVFITSHSRSIGSVGIAIAVHYGIPFSDSFKPSIMPPDDEELISMVMEKQNLSREDAMEWLINEDPGTFCFPPHIPEAAAVFFDLEAKVVVMIYSGVRQIF